MLLVKPLFNMGDLKGNIYDFENVGDVLERHSHTVADVHITIVARGRIKAMGDGWEQECEAGKILNFEPNNEHEFVALEDNSRIINIIKNYIFSQQG
jgi:quercetin dioxygenase-like cupin family protein